MVNWGGIARLLGLALVIPVLIAIATPPAEAASSTCRKLERQLANASRGKVAKRYAVAIRKQERELVKAQRRQRAGGCKSGIRGLFGGAECRQLNSVIRRMQGNLANLRAQSGGGARAERARILASLNANGCRDNKKSKSKLRPVSVKRQIAPALDNTDRNAGRRLLRNGTGGSVRHTGDTYRTLCVRTCDGYYFPVSFSTTRDNFSRDQEACQQMCPGAETKLYYHSVRTEESEDMVAVEDDRPYAALSTAFLYRTRGVAAGGSCSCQGGGRNFSVTLGGDADGEQALKSAAPVIPVNTWRLDPLTDPETYANLRGGFDPSIQKRMLGGAPSPALAAADSRSVRVVGPVFLPDPEGAIDLRAPAPSALR